MASSVFPPELLRIIVGEVASLPDNDALRSCNATSRSLSHLARQHLFKCIIFNDDEYESGHNIDEMFSDVMAFYDHLSPPRANYLGISQYVKEVLFVFESMSTVCCNQQRFFSFLRDPRFAKTLNRLSRRCCLTMFGFKIGDDVQWSQLTQGLRKAFTSIINSSHIRDLKISGLSSVPIDLFDRSHATNLFIYSVTPDSTTRPLYPKGAEPRLRLLSLETDLSFDMTEAYGNSSGKQTRPTHLISISQVKTLVATIDDVSDVKEVCNLLRANDGSLELLELNTTSSEADLKQLGAIDFEHFRNLKILNISSPFPSPSIPYDSRVSFQVDQVLCLLQGSSSNAPLQRLKLEIAFGHPRRLDNFLEDACAPGDRLDTLDATLSDPRFSGFLEVEICFSFLDHTRDSSHLHPYFPTWLPRMFPRLSKSTKVQVKLT